MSDHTVMVTTTRPRTTALGWGALVATCLVLAACSDDDSAPATLPPLVTSTTTTTVRPSATTTVRTTTTPPPRPTTTPASSTTTSPAVTSSPTSAPARAYAPVPGPTLPEVTTAIDPGWLQADGRTLGRVADGAYWAEVTGTGTGPRQFVELRLIQAFFDDACTARFGTGDDACNNDYGILEQPSGLFPAFVDTPYVTVVDEATKESYAVGGAELYSLAAGRAPGSGAPRDFLYVPFPFLVTVEGGAVVRLEQVWVP